MSSLLFDQFIALVLLCTSKKFELFEELFDLSHMKGTVKGEDIWGEFRTDFNYT